MQPIRLLCPWDSPGKNTEWVAISYSRDGTRASCIASQILYPLRQRLKIVKPGAWCYLSTEHNPDNHPSLSPQLQHLLSVHPQSPKTEDTLAVIKKRVYWGQDKPIVPHLQTSGRSVFISSLGHEFFSKNY